MYQHFNELFNKWDVNQILSFIKKNSFDKIKNEIHKTREQLFKLSDKASVTNNKIELNKIAEESKPLHENMDDWIKLRQFFSTLFLEFENEFYKERNKELEQEQKITTEKRKQALVKTRQAKRENEKKQKQEQLNKEKSASKIQKWFRRQHTEKNKYSVNILLYGYRNDIETMSEEELNKVKEEHRRKKIKFFYGYIYNKANNNIQKVMFMQKSKPPHILIKMNKNEHEKYNEKYTYNAQVLKDRYKQMVLDNHGNLSKLQQKISFHNTDEDYEKLVSICKKD